MMKPKTKVLTAVLLCGALVLAFTACAGCVLDDEKLDNAISDYLNSSYDTAIPVFQELAEKGNSVAMDYLGMSYYSGNGVQKDYTKAFEWLQKSAEAGNIDGMVDLAEFCYCQGCGTPKDEVKAFEWVQKAAKTGDGYAMFELGTYYASGIGTTKDEVKAFEWYQKAAEAGDINAIYRLAKCYESGIGTEIDLAKADEWMQKLPEWHIAIMKHAEMSNAGLL